MGRQNGTSLIPAALTIPLMEMGVSPWLLLQTSKSPFSIKTERRNPHQRIASFAFLSIPQLSSEIAINARLQYTLARCLR